MYGYSLDLYASYINGAQGVLSVNWKAVKSLILVENLESKSLGKQQMRPFSRKPVRGVIGVVATRQTQPNARVSR